MKADGDVPDGWKVCKIIEAEPNGELKFDQDNLQKLLSIVVQKGNNNLPIELVSFLGPPTSGLPFYTNVLAAYLKADGKAWSRKIRDEGLFGFEMQHEQSSQRSDGISTTAAEHVGNGLVKVVDDKKQNGHNRSTNFGVELPQPCQNTSEHQTTKQPDLMRVADQNGQNGICRLTTNKNETELVNKSNGKHDQMCTDEDHKKLKEKTKVIKASLTEFKDDIQMLLKKGGKSDSYYAILENVMKNLDDVTDTVLEDFISLLEVEAAPCDFLAENMTDQHKFNRTENLKKSPVTMPSDKELIQEYVVIDGFHEDYTEIETSDIQINRVTHHPNAYKKTLASGDTEIRAVLSANGAAANPTTTTTTDLSAVSGGLVKVGNRNKITGHTHDVGDEGPYIDTISETNSNGIESLSNGTKRKSGKARDSSRSSYSKGHKSLPLGNDCSPNRMLRNGKCYSPTAESDLPGIRHQNKPDVPLKKPSLIQRHSPTKNNPGKVKIAKVQDVCKIEEPAHNPVPSTVFCPDEEASGIYFWPELIPMDVCGVTKLFWIMHIHFAKKDQIHLTQNIHPLNVFLAVTSLKLVDIRQNKLSLFNLIKDKLSAKQLGSRHSMNICQQVMRLRVIQSDEEETNGSFYKNVFTYYTTGKEVTPAAGKGSFVNLSASQCRSLALVMRRLTNTTDVSNEKNFLNAANIAKFIETNAAKVNAFFGLKELPVAPEKETSDQDHVGDEETPPSEPSHLVRDITPVKTLPVPLDPKENSVLPVDSVKEESKVNGYPMTDDNVSDADSDDDEVSGGGLQLCKREKEEPQDMPAVKIEDKINSVYEDLQNKFEPHLSGWMEQQLKRDNISYISLLLEVLLEDARKNYIEEIGDAKMEDVLREVTLKTNVELKPILLTLASALGSFIREVDQRFDASPTHTPEHLKSIFEHAFLINVKGIHREAALLKYIRTGCMKLTKEYKAEYTRRLTRMSILEDGLLQIRSFYKSVMTKILASANFLDPAFLQSCHDSVATRLETVFRSMATEVNAVHNLPNLGTLLAENFEEFNESNMSKLNKFQKVIKDLSEQRKEEYAQKMKLIVDENPGGLETKDLSGRHEKTKRDVTNSFCKDVSSKVAKDEPVDKHVEVLHEHLKKTYQMLEKQNQKKIEKMKTEPRKPTNGHPTSSSYSAINNINHGNLSSESVCPDTKPANDPDQPLLLHLSVQNILTALPQESGGFTISPIPTQVGVSTTGEWLCGQELTKALSDNAPRLQKVWNLEDYWQNPTGEEAISKNEIILDRKEVKITIEFLLGILFAFIKNQTQVDVKSRRSRILISVPFWFTSFRRQQILDAAAIASYVNVHLINENTASAYFAYASELHDSSNNTVVISENSCKVDVALYSFNRSQQKLTMAAHVGDYEPTETSSGYFMLSTLLDVLQKTKNYVTGGGSQENSNTVAAAQEKLSELWRLILTRAQEHRPGIVGKPMNVLICCESDYWRQLLWKLAANIADPQFISVRNDSSICGMHILNQLSGKDDDFTGMSWLEEGMSVDLLFGSPSAKSFTRLRKGVAFDADNGKCMSLKIPFSKEIHIFQDVGVKRNTVGILSFFNLRNPSTFHEVEITLQRSSHGKIECYGVTGIAKVWRSYVPHNLSESKHYVWEGVGLNQIQLLKYQSVLNSAIIVHSTKKNVAALKIEKAIQMASLLEQQIHEGVITFKNRVTRSLMLEQVETALQTLKTKDICDREMETQIELIQNLVTQLVT